MQVRHTDRAPQTSKQAKAVYKKYGPRISSQESRQLERGAELYRRAEKIRESEKKRQIAKKRKQEREDRERDARRRLNIPSQKPAIARSQYLLEGFVQIVKPATRTGQEDAIAEQGAKPDPWIDDDLDDGALLHAATPKQCQVEPQASGLNAPTTAEQPARSLHSEARLDINLEDALFSNTQVERELEEPRQVILPKPIHETDPFLFSLSTQDVSMTEDDLQELGLPLAAVASRSKSSNTVVEHTDHDRILMPPPPKPRPKPELKASQLLRPKKPVVPYEFDDFGLSTQDLQLVVK